MVNLQSEPMAFSIFNLCFSDIEDFLNMLSWNCKLDYSADLKPLVSGSSFRSVYYTVRFVFRIRDL
jgi:hypothetical protein